MGDGYRVQTSYFISRFAMDVRPGSEPSAVADGLLEFSNKQRVSIDARIDKIESDERVKQPATAGGTDIE